MNAPDTAVRTDLFVTVPEVTLPNGTVVPSFQVGQYLCTPGDDGKAAIAADVAPWVSINFREARAASENSGYKLITELQWLAIAHDVANQDTNWTGGKVGEGDLFQGIREDNVNSAQPGSYESPDESERRWLTLSNGGRLCDFNGNAYSWVFDDVQGDENGLATIITADSISLQAPFPSLENGMGWRPDGQRDWSGSALIRGGCWYSGSDAGVFYLLLDWPDHRGVIVGFRCTKGL